MSGKIIHIFMTYNLLPKKLIIFILSEIVDDDLSKSVKRLSTQKRKRRNLPVIEIFSLQCKSILISMYIIICIIWARAA